MAKTFGLPALMFGCVLCNGPVTADDKIEHGFVNRVHKGTDGFESKYVIFVPHDYTGAKHYPLVLFLHGAGSTGTDGQKQVSGIAAEIRKHEKSFPAIVIFPQSQEKSWRAASADGKRALAILGEV